ncbi:hypothetical protein [Halobaculum sp. EA56]|uniref:hypothetical protein n=1 Tax=Halobaculum sp. EA56 TaxID=3421648 RepID=UPI003EBA1BE9
MQARSDPRYPNGTSLADVRESVIRKYFSIVPRRGTAVMGEDWDTLLVLDACRYDLFAEVHGFSRPLESRTSRGSCTAEFFEENFAGTTHHDTVYVTANPVPRVDEWCSVDLDAVFHAVVDVWEDHWDGEVNTVRPTPVADAIRDAHAEYPNKRVIGHFIQPHQPFIGETGLGITESGMTAYDKLSGAEPAPGKKVWARLRDGELSAERVWRAYRENLELVLPFVRDLCAELTGKTVVTSDHGNLLGEFAWPVPLRGYGHPEGVYTGKLVTVPWLETDFEERREVTSDPPRGTGSAAGEEEPLERLAHLGYR